MNIDTNAPNAITTPPILGMGSQCTFRSVGKSIKFTLQARLIKIGISKMVTIVDIRKAENSVINWYLKDLKKKTRLNLQGLLIRLNLFIRYFQTNFILMLFEKLC
jgi:hypothetical protein